MIDEKVCFIHSDKFNLQGILVNFKNKDIFKLISETKKKNNIL